MSKISTESRTYDIASRYIVTGESIRTMAKHFKLSKSTIYNYLTRYADKYLPYYIINLINKRIKSNKDEHKFYGKLLPSYNYMGDIVLGKSDTYSNGEFEIPMKDFFDIELEK